MKPSERRAQMKAEMADRARESYNSKDDSGKYKSIFLPDKIGNTQRWKCSEDEHFINIIPYIAGPNNPVVPEGKTAYFLDIWVHGKVGVNENSYVCLARSYKKPCAICEHQVELRKQDDYDDKYVKSLNPSRRAIYNIECLDSDKEIAKKVQIWDASHFKVEKEIAELAKKPREGGFITFADPDNGKTLFFRKSGSTQFNTEYKAFRFEDRTEPIPDELLDLALPLDECFHIPTYEEVKNAFFGADIDTGACAEVPQRETAPLAEERRPASRTTAPAPTPAAEEFNCPGEPVKDFGNFEACDKCPDIEACEKEFNAMEMAAAEEAARIEKEKAAEAAKPAEPAATSAFARRRLATAGETVTAPAPAAEPTTAQPAEGAAPERRVRRRPGQ